ncbi:hypothetical protein [Halomonas aquatica]|uniref:Uncharacterized protein n=1 Tax=Halomonas aquatica TaxID=3151123 RepID=A0ABV1NG56_9GAMM
MMQRHDVGLDRYHLRSPQNRANEALVFGYGVLQGDGAMSQWRASWSFQGGTSGTDFNNPKPNGVIMKKASITITALLLGAASLNAHACFLSGERTSSMEKNSAYTIALTASTR